MKTALALLLLLPAPAVAGQCYMSENHPSWKVIVDDGPGLPHEMSWSRSDGFNQRLRYESAPPGEAPRFVIGSTDDERFSIGFVGEPMVLDGELYRPGCP
jgi:hypothetical protein